jgi:hypothetical protein
MISQENLVSDLELRLSKAKPSNEFDLTYEQMAQWVDMACDEFTREYIKSQKTIDDSLIMEISNITPYEVNGDFLLDLDGNIPLDIKMGRGIAYVRDSSGNYLSKAANTNKKFISAMTFTKPSNCHIVYSLYGGSSLLLEGLTYTNMTYDVGLIPSEVARIKLPSDKMFIVGSSVRSILEIAEEIGLRQMTGRSLYDVDNDGLGNRIE